MAFIDSKLKDTYLLTTEVENLFINESMIDAPSDYVKVYLYGLYTSKYQKEKTVKDISRTLNMEISVVDMAFSYWEELGLIKKIYRGEEYDIQYVSQRDLLYGNVKEETLLEREEFTDLALKDIYSLIEKKLGRPLSIDEYDKIKCWKRDLKATKDVIIEAILYCTSRGKNNINYIEKVILSWVKEGIKTKEDVENHLEEVGERQEEYKKILKSLGLNRNATQAEKDLMDTWFNDMHFNLNRILEACARTISTSNPNLRYVNKILENWKDEATAFNRDVNKKVTISIGTVNEYLAFLRSEHEKEKEEKLKEIYEKIPKIQEIDSEIENLQRNATKKILKGEDISGLREKINNDLSLRAALLTENNFPIDYTDLKYSCSKCKDRGVDDNGLRCSCFNERFNEAEVWQKKNN